MDESKTRLQVMRKAQLSADQMKELAFAYKRRVAELAPRAIELLDQGRFIDIMLYCAAVVMHSFEADPARKYREAAGIHGNWRTPVVYNAWSTEMWNEHPPEPAWYRTTPSRWISEGTSRSADQGTDVVNGKVSTIPVYDRWQKQETLASQMPGAWKQLSSILFRTAERLHFDTRLEYTIEKGKVFILQIRKDRERKERIASLEKSGYQVIARGTGVSGKIFRGILVTDRTQIAPFRHINKAQSIIDSMNEQLS